MESVYYRELKEYEINVALFAGFNRYQDVRKCWRKEDGKWILKDIAFTEQWSTDEYEFLIKYLRNTVKTGGAVFGGFVDNVLVGFASVEGHIFGSQREYLQLSNIHVSYERRGMGIGKKLFFLACKKAGYIGAEKLYISAHSAQETQAFYRAMGCAEAEEYNDELSSKEPCDCQLEYIINN